MTLCLSWITVYSSLVLWMLWLCSVLIWKWISNVNLTLHRSYFYLYSTNKKESFFYTSKCLYKRERTMHFYMIVTFFVLFWKLQFFSYWPYYKFCRNSTFWIYTHLCLSYQFWVAKLTWKMLYLCWPEVLLACHPLTR